MRAWIPSRRSYSFTLSDVTHRIACAAPGYIAPEVLQLMEIAGISDFESLAASTNAPVFTPQTDDFGLAVHIFKMLNRGIHPYASGELDLDIFDLDDDDIPPAPLINSCVCNGHSPFVGTLVGYVVQSTLLSSMILAALWARHSVDRCMAGRRSVLTHAHGRACSTAIYPRQLCASVAISTTRYSTNALAAEESAPC